MTCRNTAMAMSEGLLETSLTTSYYYLLLYLLIIYVDKPRAWLLKWLCSHSSSSGSHGHSLSSSSGSNRLVCQCRCRQIGYFLNTKHVTAGLRLL